MKKQIGKRLLSFVLVLVMVLGMMPMNLTPKARAVTPEEQTVAEALLQRINTMETGERFSKYVRVTGFHAPDVKDYPTAQTTLKGLRGYYIVVNADPIEEGSDMHYALNAGKEVAYSNFAVDRVQMVGNQLFGADPKGALYIAYDATTSQQSNQEAYSETSAYTTARARYTLKNREGKHFVISKTNSRVEMRTVGVTTTLFAKYTTGCVRFMKSSTYNSTTDEKLGMRFNTTGAVPFVDYGTEEYPTYCYLYEENTNRVNVEPLYDAIVEAKAYINNCNPYEEEHYSAFLTALENALNEYPKYNVDSYGDDVATAESKVNDLAQALRDATSLIKPYDEQINELLIPATQRLTSLDQIQEGSYFILSLDRNGFYTTFDPASKASDSNSCKTFNKLIPVSVTGEQVEVTDLLGSESLYAIPSGGYSIQLSSGEYLQMTDNSQTGSNQDNAITDNPMSMTFVERADMLTSHENAHTDINAAFLIKVTGDTIYLATSNGNNKMYAYRNTDATEKKGSDEYDKYLYRISDVTLKLFEALEYVEPYGVGNADGRYDEAVYADFAAKVSVALNKYRANRHTMSDATLQTELDDLAAELKEYAQKLTLADSHASYIDIPIEVLDFRSDRFLFEFYSGSDGYRYALSNAIAQTDYPTGDPLLLPLYEAMEANTKRVKLGNTNVRVGMLLPDLVGGNPTYAEHTVGFIAARILKEWMHDPNSSLHNTHASEIAIFDHYLENVDTQDVIWNTAKSFYDAYHAAGKTQAEKEAILGSFEKTVAKTLTGKNGGDLPWEEVTTVFDLAYYALNNIWRPVSDTLGVGKEPYNTVVPERDTLRMYLDQETGLYTIDSANRTVYDGYRIYNTVPFVDNGNLRFPQMIPVNGLGFEKNNTKDTDPTTNLYTHYGWEKAMKDVNFGFMLHASGSFVYYEGQEQKFDFVGDDDVYFFINGTLVMDLGGTHSPAGGSLLLSEANTKYNLGMEDEGVYSFDMFYAERHTFSSNMKFSTNIKIFSPDAITTKGQYIVQTGGAGATDPITGKGSPVADNTGVFIGDIMAYSFDLLNTKDVPLVNVRMEDPTLGVSLSPTYIGTYEGQVDGQTVISLTDPDADHANGVVTRFDNLLLEYRTLDTNNKPVSQPVQSLSAGRMLDLLTLTADRPEGAQNWKYTSLPEGCYRVRVENADELSALLQAGIPTKCSFSLYGFLRKVKSTDTPYINELTTYCDYPRSSHIDAEYSTVTGKASRMIRALENSNMPQVRKLDVVLDYGKAVAIPLEDIVDLVHFEDGSPARVGEVIGFVNEGYNGQVLKKQPVGMFCTETGDTMQKEQGFFSRRATDLTFTPDQFLDRIHGLFAVIAIEDFYYGTKNTEQFHYVLAQLALTPAHVMYYETDFAPDSNIFTLTQAGSFEDVYERENDVYQEWSRIEDQSGSADPYQDYERLNGTVYHTDIDPEYIPAEAFFVDFDGEGYERRYRDNPQYSGIDFDKGNAWYSHNKQNSSYNKHTLNAAEGTMELTNIKSKDSNGPLGAWIQTIIPTGTLGSTPLKLHAGHGYFAQIRFRVENCDSYNSSGNISLFFSNSKDVETTDKNVALDGRRARLPLVHEEVLKGDFMTVKIPLDNTYFSQSEEIDILRIYIAGYTGLNNDNAKITIDYIYIGPEFGMEDDIYGNYMFVGFDNTPEVPLRYSSSIYGTDSRFNTAYRPLDTAGAWESSSAKDSIRIQKGLEGDANNGYIYFEDKLDDSQLDAKATKNYSYIHAGSIATGNGIYNYPINYTPTRNDFCQIRIKIENGGIVPEQVLGLGIEYSKGNICGKANLDTSYLDGNFHTITFPLDAPYWKKHWIENKAKLNWLHPVVYNLQAKNGATTGAKITIDYIFIGPEHMLDRVSQHAKPGTEQVNHLFFDFNNNDAAKVRYTYPIYGSTATNYDLQQNWSVDADSKIDSIGSGVITFSDKDATKTFNYIHSAANFWNTPLAFTPGKNDFLRIRMKIDKGTSGTAPDGIMSVALENFEGDNFFSYGIKDDYSFAEYADGKYHIFTIPLNTEDYLTEDVITAVRPVINGTQNCTFTIDYIYIGPLTEGNPSAPSLYFGFGDRGSGHWNTDRLRYDSDTYGFLNYDTNCWLSESEAVTSSLTQNIYGWKTAGNENRGNPVDAAIKDYVPPFPPTENVSYPNVAVAPKPDTGNLEVVVEAAAGTTADTVAIQTYPSISSPRYYWRHFMQTLNYHPAEENIVQVRFRTEGLTIKDNFAVKLMYLPTGASAFCTSDPLKLAPQMPLNPEEDYVIMTAQLDDTFDNAPAIERLRLVFEGVTAENGDKILIDYVYAGVGRLAPEPVYGYDSSYLNDTKLSNGSSYVVTGRGVKTQYQTDKYTEASFSFRGTGFDIISRTDMNQGSIRVEVWKKGADKSKEKAVKTLTVNNKGELELFQIPVVSVQGLPYGDYDVTLWVNAPVKTPYEFLNHKGNFHFDAVRIYDPMGEDTGLAPEVLFTYLVDTEGYASVKEVRNILLSAENFASQLTGSGAIFVDSAEEPTATVPATDNNGETIPGSTAVVKPEGIDVNGHITASVTTYDKIGPKNEVYLAPGQAVAFMLKISTEYAPTSVDVGVKAIKANEPANLVAGIVTKGNATANGLMQIDGRRDVTIRSATAQYYALPIDADTFFTAQDNNRYCYIVLYNNGTAGTVTNVLSVTDIKVAYDKEPEIGLPQDAVTDKEIQKRSGNAVETYYDFVVDSHTLEAAALVMKAVLETPLLAEGTKLMHSLNLASDISVNYAVTKESMAGYDSFYLEVMIPGRKDPLRIAPVEKDYHYYFTVDGLTAVQMTEILEATLYMEKDGRIYYSEPDRYSIAQYAYAQLDKSSVSATLKSLCADLLRYGAAAQIYKNYRTDALADAAVTEAHKAYQSDIEAVTFGNTNKVLNNLDNAPISWTGKSLNLESKVALKFAFHPVNYQGDPSTLTLKVSYTDINGELKTLSLGNPELYNPDMGLYVFTLDALLAAELRSVVSVQIYAGNNPVSCTLQYSADTYGNNKTGALLDLCKALFAYSDSAREYFIR